MQKLGLLLTILILFGLVSCKEKGCTDPDASNFDYYAEKEDGSCEYKGCTDPDAYNYDEDALEDDGSCGYYGYLGVYTTLTVGNGKMIDVFVNNDFVGRMQGFCGNGVVTCSLKCVGVKNLELKSKNYKITGYYLKQIGTGYNDVDTLQELAGGSIYVLQDTCVVFNLSN